MDVVTSPDGKPFVVETHSGHGDHSYGNYGSCGNQDWPEKTSERVKDSVSGFFFSASAQAAQRAQEAAVATAGVSKDVAILSKDVVITEGRLAVQVGTVTKDIALLNRDMALTEARLTLVAAQNAAAAAECCCELKALILQQNGETRDLINSNKIRELELKLAANGLGK